MYHPVCILCALSPHDMSQSVDEKIVFAYSSNQQILQMILNMLVSHSKLDVLYHPTLDDCKHACSCRKGSYIIYGMYHPHLNDISQH